MQRSTEDLLFFRVVLHHIILLICACTDGKTQVIGHLSEVKNNRKLKPLTWKVVVVAYKRFIGCDLAGKKFGIWPIGHLKRSSQIEVKLYYTAKTNKHKPQKMCLVVSFMLMSLERCTVVMSIISL